MYCYCFCCSVHAWARKPYSSPSRPAPHTLGPVFMREWSRWVVIAYLLLRVSAGQRKAVGGQSRAWHGRTRQWEGSAVECSAVQGRARPWEGSAVPCRPRKKINSVNQLTRGARRLATHVARLHEPPRTTTGRLQRRESQGQHLRQTQMPASLCWVGTHQKWRNHDAKKAGKKINSINQPTRGARRPATHVVLIHEPPRTNSIIYPDEGRASRRSCGPPTSPLPFIGGARGPCPPRDAPLLAVNPCPPTTFQRNPTACPAHSDCLLLDSLARGTPGLRRLACPSRRSRRSSVG